MKMKTKTLLLSLIAVSAFAGQLPTDLLDTIKDPPNISENTAGAFAIPENTGAIIIGPGFISYISLLDGETSESASYKFRTYSTAHKLEIQGEGQVFEKYYRVRAPDSPNSNTTVIDKGSKLEIDAGLFKITWSASRHLYAGKGIVKIQAGSEQRYLDLIKNEE